jgi:hypothetical protein
MTKKKKKKKNTTPRENIFHIFRHKKPIFAKNTFSLMVLRAKDVKNLLLVKKSLQVPLIKRRKGAVRTSGEVQKRYCEQPSLKLILRATRILFETRATSVRNLCWNSGISQDRNIWWKSGRTERCKDVWQFTRS